MSGSKTEQAFRGGSGALPTKLSTAAVENLKSRFKSSTYGRDLKLSGGSESTVSGAAGGADESIVPVLVESPRHAAMNSVLSYRSRGPLTAGTLVRVPLGRRQVTGLAWSPGAESSDPAKLRDIAEVCTGVPPVSPEWRALVDFAASYYQRGLGEIALSVLPPELRRLGAAALADRVRRLHRSLDVDATTTGRRRGGVQRGASEAAGADESPPSLTPDQARAVAAIVQAIDTAAPGTMLLHG